MPADLRLIDPESGGPLPADLFGDVNLAAPKMTLRRVWVRNVGDVPAVQVLVEVSGGIEVSSDGPFGGRVRLLDIPPGGERLVSVRRPAATVRGRQTATLKVRGLGVT